MDADTVLEYGDPAGAALNGIVPKKLLSAQADTKKQEVTDINAEQAEKAPIIQKAQDLSSTPMPTAPKPYKPTAAPDAQQFNKDSQGWVVALSALSALVGSRGRSRGTGALKAFAGGLKGLKEGNQQAFDNATKTWKENTDAMFKASDEEFKEYQANMDNRKQSLAEMDMNNKLIAAKWDNKLTMDARNTHDMAAIVEGYAKAKWQTQMAYDKMLEHEKMQQDKQKQEEQKQEEDYMKYKDSDLAKHDLASYHKGLPISDIVGASRMGKGAMSAGQRLANIERLDAETGGTGEARAKAVQDYHMAYVGLSSIGNGQMGKFLDAANTAYQHGNTVADLAIALGNGDVPRINALKQQYEFETGEAAPTNFDAAKNLWADEVNKAGVGGVGALTDREEIKKTIQRANSPDQILGAKSVYNTMIAGSVYSRKLRYQYETKRDGSEFNTILVPELAVNVDKVGKSMSAPAAGAPAGGDYNPVDRYGLEP